MLAALLAGCGKQGPPAPPLRAVPAPTKDLAVRQQGGRVLLTFSFPKLTPAGTALGGLSGVEVVGVERPAPPPPQDARPAPLEARELAAAGTVVAKLAAGDVAPATFGDRMIIALPLPEPLPAAPQARHYAVRTVGPEGDRSELSNVVALVPKAPPAPPERVTVTARAEGVQVEWTAREGAAGYNVYRRGAQERAHGHPLHTAGAEERSYVDASARFGESYIYAVTTAGQRDPLIESAIGSEREVRYQDRFAPPPPAEPVALAETGRIRLLWQASDAAGAGGVGGVGDVAGYVVYRRRGTAGDFVRLTAQPVAETEYVDSAVAADEIYFYRVTAVDQLGNESAPGTEVAAALP
jgi:hypothetical protein